MTILIKIKLCSMNCLFVNIHNEGEAGSGKKFILDFVIGRQIYKPKNYIRRPMSKTDIYTH